MRIDWKASAEEAQAAARATGRLVLLQFHSPH